MKNIIFLLAVIGCTNTPTGTLSRSIASMGGSGGVTDCYLRIYTPKRLAENPGQIVHKLFVAFANEGDKSTIALSADVKTDEGLVTSYGKGFCDKKGKTKMDCALEGDAGRFTYDIDKNVLTFLVSDALRLQADMKNSKTVSEVVLNKGKPDGVYYLYQSPLKDCGHLSL